MKTPAQWFRLFARRPRGAHYFRHSRMRVESEPVVDPGAIGGCCLPIPHDACKRIGFQTCKPFFLSERKIG
jgi:GT2 family glycosyltransferase